MNYKEVFELAQEKGYRRWAPVLIEDYNTDDDEFWAVSEAAMLQKWLRDEHAIDIIMEVDTGIDLKKVYYGIVCTGIRMYRFLSPKIPSYESALIHSLYEALKLLP